MLQIPTYLEQEHKRVKSTDTYLEHEQLRIHTHITAFFKKNDEANITRGHGNTDSNSM